MSEPARQFSLTLRLSDAVQDNHDLAAMLVDVADQVSFDHTLSGLLNNTQSIRDTNGNRVGGYRIEEIEY